MKSLNEHLSNYAAYHRDRRNIATHFFGVPMIVLGVAALLSRPAFAVGAVTLSPATFVIAGSVLFYLLLDLRFGVVMGMLMGLSGWFGASLATETTAVWLSGSLGLFVVGWVIQFVGHYYEGRKPAFVDDLIGLLLGPLFVVAEAGFALRMRDEVRQAVEAKVGPTLIRERRHAA